MIDSIDFGAQTADVSFGRLTDGGSQTGSLSDPTPGASNSGIDPHAPKFTSVLAAQGQITLNWNGAAGEAYRIEYKTNVSDPTWTLLRTVTATGSGGTTTDQISGNRRFYRFVK